MTELAIQDQDASEEEEPSEEAIKAQRLIRVLKQIYAAVLSNYTDKREEWRALLGADGHEGAPPPSGKGKGKAPLREDPEQEAPAVESSEASTGDIVLRSADYHQAVHNAPAGDSPLRGGNLTIGGRHNFGESEEEN